jgi:hypothetical protein
MPNEKDSDSDWSQKIAGLVVDSLVQAKIIALADFEWATRIAAEEILARLALEDRPGPSYYNRN